jgi:hypothetical protein
MRRVGLALQLLAALLWVLADALPGARSLGAASSDPRMIPVCTASGIVSVPAPADDAGVPADSGSEWPRTHPCCLLPAGGAALVSTPLQPPPPSASRRFRRRFFSRRCPRRPRLRPVGARAPPLPLRISTVDPVR